MTVLSHARYTLGLFAATLLCLAGSASSSYADPPPNDECSTGWCGTPRQSGGGGCGCGGGSVLVNNTDDGKTYQHTDDFDADGVPDTIDNCPYTKNHDQLDSDGDGRGDACDNCPQVANYDQSDVNGNGLGDVCDPDADSDGIPNAKDNCPLVPNPGQEMHDTHSGKNLGDVCNPDMDGDGVPNAIDNCPLIYNPDQKTDGFAGQACDYDADKDGIDNAKDNCPGVYNPDQKRTLPVRGTDNRGDACNTDIDYDGLANNIDNCPMVANKDQKDADNDGVGDACDHKYCFVIQRQDKGACLDPTNTFQVYSPTLPFLDPQGKVVAEDDPVTGRPVRLRLFTNRQNIAVRYTWTVASRPDGSQAVVDNPQGAMAFSTLWEMHYQADRIATFTPDVPGRYVLKVSAEEVFADSVNPDWPRASVYEVTLGAKGDSLAGGCSASAVGAAGRATSVTAAFGMLLFAGLWAGLWARLRRRQRVCSERSAAQ